MGRFDDDKIISHEDHEEYEEGGREFMFCFPS